MIAKRPTPLLIWFTRLFFPRMNLYVNWFTFGKNIYGPEEIPPEILVHEQVHIKQQGNILLAIPYLILYVWSNRFRYRMELPAYQAQLTYYRQQSWDKAERYHVAIAKLMSGPHYNHMVSFDKAYADLKVLL